MRFFELAIKFSETSTHPEQKHAVFVIRGGKLISKATNAGWNHAEARALRPHDDFSGAKLLSVRSNRKISKPCPKCMVKIRAANIKQIIYVDIHDNLIRERVR